MPRSRVCLRPRDGVSAPACCACCCCRADGAGELCADGRSAALWGARSGEKNEGPAAARPAAGDAIPCRSSLLADISLSEGRRRGDISGASAVARARPAAGGRRARRCQGAPAEGWAGLASKRLRGCAAGDGWCCSSARSWRCCTADMGSTQLSVLLRRSCCRAAALCRAVSAGGSGGRCRSSPGQLGSEAAGCSCTRLPAGSSSVGCTGTRLPPASAGARAAALCCAAPAASAPTGQACGPHPRAVQGLAWQHVLSCMEGQHIRRLLHSSSLQGNSAQGGGGGGGGGGGRPGLGEARGRAAWFRPQELWVALPAHSTHPLSPGTCKCSASR